MLKTRLLEDNLGKQLHDLRIGSNKQKAQFIKKKIHLHENKVLFIKNIMKRVKRQATKKMVTCYTFVSKIHKELLMIQQASNSIIRNGEDVNRCFTEEELHLPQTHEEMTNLSK